MINITFMTFPSKHIASEQCRIDVDATFTSNRRRYDVV